MPVNASELTDIQNDYQVPWTCDFVHPGQPPYQVRCPLFRYHVAHQSHQINQIVWICVKNQGLDQDCRDVGLWIKGIVLSDGRPAVSILLRTLRIFRTLCSCQGEYLVYNVKWQETGGIVFGEALTYQILPDTAYTRLMLWQDDLLTKKDSRRVASEMKNLSKEDIIISSGLNLRTICEPFLASFVFNR